MRIVQKAKKFSLVYMFAFLLAIALVACGSATTSTGTNTGQGANGTSSGSKQPAPPSDLPGYGTSHGCPSNAVVKTAPPKANVIVHEEDMNKPITAHTGDSIEIQLPFGHKWTGPMTSQGVLEVQPPSGYAVQTSNVCVWRFIAKGTGSTQLEFHSQALCKPGQMCPMFITNVPVTINVQ